MDEQLKRLILECDDPDCLTNFAGLGADIDEVRQQARRGGWSVLYPPTAYSTVRVLTYCPTHPKETT